MQYYNWKTPIKTLLDDGLISDTLYYALHDKGIDVLDDLDNQAGEMKSAYLKKQLLFLNNFLHVIIQDPKEIHGNEIYDEYIPKDLLSSIRHICRTVTVNDKYDTILDMVFHQPEDILFALVKSRSNVFSTEYHNFSDSKEYDAFRSIMIYITVGLRDYCECFEDCQFYAIFISRILADGSIGQKEIDESKEFIDKGNDKVSLSEVEKTLDDRFSQELSHLPIRTKNVLARNGITAFDDIRPWVIDKSKSFLSLNSCGKKSADELNLLRDEMVKAYEDFQSVNIAGVFSNEVTQQAIENITHLFSETTNIKATLRILKVYGTTDKFCMSFITFPKETYKDINAYYLSDSFRVCYPIMEILANYITICDDNDVTECIENALKEFTELSVKNRSPHLDDLVLTEGKKQLLKAEFNSLYDSEILMTRSKSVLRRYVDRQDADSIVSLISHDYDFTEMDNSGDVTATNIYVFIKILRKYFSEIMFEDDEKVNAILLGKIYPFLDNEEIRFLNDFEREKGYYPVFFILERYYARSKKKNNRVYAYFYGIGCERQDKGSIAKELGLESTESIRKDIINEKDNVKEIIDVAILKDSMGHYEFLNYDVITLENSNFAQLKEEERLEDSFTSFCGICNLFCPNIIFDIDTENHGTIQMAYSAKARSYHAIMAVKEVKRLPKISRKQTITLNLMDYFVNDRRFWARNHDVNKEEADIALNIVTEIIKNLDLGPIDKEGNIVFEANAIDYCDECYDILSQNDSPMHIGDIFAAIKERHKDEYHNSPDFLRQYLSKDSRIEAIGYTSTYSEDFDGM